MTGRQVGRIYLQPTAYAAIAVGMGLAVSELPLLADLALLRAAVIGAAGLSVYAALVRWQAPEVWGALRDRMTAALRRSTDA